MPRHTLPRSVGFRGRIYTPGDHDDLPDEMIEGLRRKGIIPKEDGTINTPPARLSGSPLVAPAAPLADTPRPLSGPTGTIATLSQQPTRRRDPGQRRLSPSQDQGITPGDPVGRPAMALGDVSSPSAVDLRTNDPTSGMPPPVVHTAEGEAVDPATAGDAHQTPVAGQETASGDDGDLGAEDDGTGGQDGEQETETGEAPAAGQTTPTRPARTGSRPRGAQAD